MKYQQIIKQYRSDDSQEIQDQITMLLYADTFQNLLSRDNHFAHMSASSFIMNPSMDKVLMIYHNIYNSWTWTGGHADNEEDLLKVALQEAREETGIHGVAAIRKEPISLEILPVWGHIKKGHYVSSHLHLNCTYLLISDENEKLIIKPDENSGVKWVPLDQVLTMCTEKEMHPIFKKIIERINKIKLQIS